MGELMSLVLTSLLCIFWTIPVSFVASLSNVEALTEIFPFLQEPVDNYPWFSALLAFLAPLILVVFIGLLPVIILAIIKLEGLIEIETYQHPSMFSKLAAFTIIQTFFVVSALKFILCVHNITPCFALTLTLLHLYVSPPLQAHFFRRYKT